MKDAISYRGRVNHRNSEGAVDDSCFQIPFQGQGKSYLLADPGNTQDYSHSTAILLLVLLAGTSRFFHVHRLQVYLIAYQKAVFIALSSIPVHSPDPSALSYIPVHYHDPSALSCTPAHCHHHSAILCNKVLSHDGSALS